MRPHTRQSSARELRDLLIGEGVPLVHYYRIVLVVVRARSGAGVEEGNRLVQIVRDGRMPIQESAQEVLCEILGHHHSVAVVVVRGVFAPVDQGDGVVAELERQGFLDDVDFAVAPVRLGDRRDERDDVRADVLDEIGFVDGQTIRELHQHLGAAGFRRVDGSAQPVSRLCLLDDSSTIGG